ncbi:MAG: hypothetical protein ACYC0W_09740, partial [Candidatus Nanopelagicales bacterium]
YVAAIADLEIETLYVYVNSRDELSHARLEHWTSDAERRTRTTDVRTELRMPWAPQHPYDAYIDGAWERIVARDIASPDGIRRFADDSRPHLTPNVLNYLIGIHHSLNEWSAEGVYYRRASSITDY